MNTSRNDPDRPVMDEVDDLTRFLDEDFGTDEVDLFEFTSGDEESPLSQLKAIIVGLDWEITDEALQDLADEIEHLRSLEQFQNDKVSQVYLQALDKIGNYIYSEGANAHPNSIKLLLTLYYDFEKIISSDLITGAEITALLKADVRKFKILQFQIAQKHGATVPEAEAAAAELPLTDHKTLLDIHAAILELDWEVTDESIQKLAEQLEILKEQFADNRYIQIIIRGLITLNNYIDEERARTHPEAFSLLHHFFEALETLVDDKELDEEASRKILISCVNRLNTLKALITQTPQELDESAVTPVAEEEEAATTEIEELTAEEPVAEEADVAMEQPTAPAEEEYVDELDVELPVDETGEVAPALFDEGEEGGFAAEAEEAEAPPEELEEKLEFFFGGDEAPPPPPEEAVAEEAAVEEAPAEPAEAEAPAAPAAEEPAPAVSGEAAAVAAEQEEDTLDVELPVDETGEVAPALFDEEEEGGFAAAATEVEAPPEELEEKLEFFFGEEKESFEPEAVEEAVARRKAEEEELEAAIRKEEEEEAEISSVAPALSGEPEEAGFSVTEEEAPAAPEGLEEKLDFFFGEEEPAAEEASVPEVEETAETEEDIPAALFEEEDEEVLLTPELAAGETAEEALSPAGEPETIPSTPEEYREALEQIRMEFQVREQTLLDEITALKREIEGLRARLGL